MKILDLVGQRFGKLVVIKIDHISESKHTYFLCRCDCGNETITQGSNLKNGAVKSCGCLKNKIVDLTGQKFGELTVLKFSHMGEVGRKGKKASYFLCKCDCGNEVLRSGNNLSKGNTVSCGCSKVLDLKGRKIGKLTVLELTGQRVDRGSKVWKCICECGNICYRSAARLNHDKVHSCGCDTFEIKSQHGKDTIKKLHSEQVENTNLKLIRENILRKDNKTGVRGVCFINYFQKYKAYITCQKKKYSLGYYDTIEEAAKVRKVAEDEYFKPILEKYEQNVGDL